MPMQKFRADIDGPRESNGSRAWYVAWFGGETLAKVEDCPCEDGKARTVYATAHPDTYFSIPAATRVRGQYVSGFLMSDGNHGWEFVANKYGKTAGRMPTQGDA